MKVHNIYSDILKSLSYYLNKLLDHRIEKFQYNIGNSSFNLDYNPNYKFPAALINYTNSVYVNARPNTYLRNTSNINQIPVLFDKTKNIELKIQEDHFTVSVDAIINSDSQLQIMDFKHIIESLIPLNKYLQMYRFTSYFELDDEFINPYLFDVDNDIIENLFFKHNKLTDELGYFFSVSYEPLIRMTSSNLSISDITSSVFSLNLSFELMIQLPSKILFNYYNQKQFDSKYNETKHLRFSNIKVPVNTEFEYLEIKFKSIISNNIKIINCPCLKDLTLSTLNGSYITDLLNVTVTSDSLNVIDFGKVTGKINDIDIVNAKTEIITGSSNSKYGIITDHQISGKLKSVEISNNLLSCWFEGELHNSIENIKLENLNYEILESKFTASNLKIEIDDKNYFAVNNRFIKPCDIFTSIKTINRYKNEIDHNLTKITGISFYNNITTKYSDTIKILDPVEIDAHGDFSFIIQHITISGHINLKTGVISNCISDDVDFKIHELEFDVISKYFPIRGPGRIEQISIDFNSVNNLISSISPIEIGNYSPSKYNLVIDNLNISPKDQNNRYTISIQLPITNASIPTNFDFYFTKSNYRTDNNKLELILDDTLSTIETLVFSTTEQMYYMHLKSVDNIYPVFFNYPK